MQEERSGLSDLEQIPVICLIEQELHEGYHWDSSHWQIGIPEEKKIETLQVSKYRSDLDRPLAKTRGGDRAPIGTLAHQEIGIPVDKRSGESRLKNLT
jgi:hypothetical protein